MGSQVSQTVAGIDWKTTTSFINATGFLAYSLDETNFSKDPRLKNNEREALTSSSILLAIAGGHYAIIETNRPSEKSEILIRYSDWFLTTPLLLKVITAYYALSDTIEYELIAYNVLMVIAGLVYELTGKKIFWVIGVIAYLILICRLSSVLPDMDLFYRYFLFGWGLYGVVALMPRAERLLLYNFLDVYNKLVFAIDIRTRIEADILKREGVEQSQKFKPFVQSV